MKAISYSIFGSRNFTSENRFEWYAYLRGLYFNVLMNRLIYPGWKTLVHVDKSTYEDYEYFFDWLYLHHDVGTTVMPRRSEQAEKNLCKSMLWRMDPIFSLNVEYVICRDADALTTYREAQAVQEFVESGMIVHGITDNPAHTCPLMGGMCGFKAAPIREAYGSWENLIAQSKVKIGDRGTDQVFLSQEIYPKYKDQMFGHYLKGMKKTNGEAIIKRDIADFPLPGVNPALWESNLCAAFIGSAGVNEMETIRFFKRFSAEFDDKELAKKYPKIFYWYD